jgi:EAL domain-containing protein (putative c-di-GMP-specific phosphodiesterase class I)
MTINITMADLIRNDFCDWFFSRVDHWHAPVDHLGLEISGKIDSWPHYTMVSNLRTLQESGIEIILDDFGTGPNNYESVWFLEPSRVKLSKRFTKELTATEDHFRGEKPGKSATDSLKTKKQMQGHFEIIHRLTETIGVAVIAKGVESPEQAQMLEDGGFIYAQGNFFHKPVELEQVASVIREQLVQTEGDSILAADQDPENMLSLFSDEELY